MLRLALPPAPMAPPDDEPPVEPALVEPLVLCAPPLAPPVADAPSVVRPPEALLAVPEVPAFSVPPALPPAEAPPELGGTEDGPLLLVPPAEPPLPPGLEVPPPAPPLALFPACLVDEEPALAPPLAWLEIWPVLEPLFPPEAALLVPPVLLDGELAVHAPKEADRTRKNHEKVRMIAEFIAWLWPGRGSCPGLVMVRGRHETHEPDHGLPGGEGHAVASSVASGREGGEASSSGVPPSASAGMRLLVLSIWYGSAQTFCCVQSRPNVQSMLD